MCCVAPEEIRAVREGDNLAASFEPDDGSLHSADDCSSIGLPHAHEESMDAIHDNHGLAKAWGHNQADCLRMRGRVPDHADRKGRGFSGLTGKDDDNPFALILK